MNFSNLKKQKLHKSGFSLIELIVVLAIIAILALIAVPNFSNIFENAKIKRLALHFKLIEKATENYYFTVGDYPDTPMLLEADPGFVSNVGNKSGWAGPYIDEISNWQELFPPDIMGKKPDGTVFGASYVNGAKDKEIFIGSGVYRLFPWMLNADETKDMFQVILFDRVPLATVEALEQTLDHNTITLVQGSGAIDTNGKIRYKLYDSGDMAVLYYIIKKDA